ncbi:tRNA t(6)A37-methylthiotransferase [Olavius algarvensis spirochete endosymbiont]|uniref:tRNA (N(6)-L-threonylcarbamoyladenosine(37)-C(2))- methylthiotransferase MtaB n=1 Tax=Olavius algarvensis spirochete endosymbiont TaxID=260710 RepID=UPI00068FADC0|nr:tRNA (N(6)-L-threonylcarbamoyladenosine(37)-C(2))-methylthiotransferase MtaB [Olavius algarvensis spirochete endosymbiont]CAD7838391.1 MAG: tRNA t(6)A37-methylthiotransferase (EC 2.8.4.5) [Olavius algarvensis spirochete endosymbiont]VDA99989.1 tRNA t(6)A37-methylthiotransferase [Olavius algarvensis spirochete endosymbiont]
MSVLQNRKVAFKTLGCKLNQSETESMAADFLTRGWDLVDFGERADAIVFNSCTVTRNADRKSRSEMNKAMRIATNNRPHPLLVFTGCHIDANFRKSEPIENRKLEDVHFQNDGNVFLVGNMNKARIPGLVDAHFRGKFIDAKPIVAKRATRTRALIKIQDGCDNFCSFCIVPFVRGPGFSRGLDDCVAAIEEAVKAGFREMVLTGVNMGRWEQSNQTFTDLLDAALACSGDFRLRLSSIEPDGIDDRFIELMTHPKMANHLHLCLQSGSERILRLMGRRYAASEFERIVELLRRQVPGINITTDVIVGFPGETEVDFEDVFDFCERLRFGHIHVFPYSVRDDTLAASMEGQIPENEKARRAARIREVSVDTKRFFRSSLIGSRQRVLVEKASRRADGAIIASGLSSSYVPVCFAVSENEAGIRWVTQSKCECDVDTSVRCMGGSNAGRDTEFDARWTRAGEGIRNCFFSVGIVDIETGENPALLGKLV